MGAKKEAEKEAKQQAEDMAMQAQIMNSAVQSDPAAASDSSDVPPTSLAALFNHAKKSLKPILGGFDDSDAIDGMKSLKSEYKKALKNAKRAKNEEKKSEVDAERKDVLSAKKDAQRAK